MLRRAMPEWEYQAWQWPDRLMEFRWVIANCPHSFSIPRRFGSVSRYLMNKITVLRNEKNAILLCEMEECVWTWRFMACCLMDQTDIVLWFFANNSLRSLFVIMISSLLLTLAKSSKTCDGKATKKLRGRRLLIIIIFGTKPKNIHFSLVPSRKIKPKS